MLLKKTSLQMEVEAAQALLSEGVLTNMSNGGRVRSIIAAVSRQSGDLMEALDVNTAMGFATSASGYFLDLIGRGAGVSRQDATAGFALKEDRSVKFYVNVGVLKDYLPTGILPSGTVLQTSDGNVQYTVTEDTSFPDSATEVYVPAVANGSGSAYQIGRGLLTVHSLGSPNILSTNEKAIANGGDPETDDNYRYRILNHAANAATGNMISIRLAALSTPGVAEAVIKRYFQGPGTMDVLLTPVGNKVTASMINGAAARISRISAGGDYVTVRGPRYVNIVLSTKVDFTKDTPDTEKPDVRTAVRRNQLDYLDDIPLGGQLIMSELRARTQESSSRILDHEILCFKIDGRPQILRNWRLFEDELFLPDPDVDNPIEVI